jgi:hypothetical protein
MLLKYRNQCRYSHWTEDVMNSDFNGVMGRNVSIRAASELLRVPIL